MRLVIHMVARNEANRYLDACLAHAKTISNEIFVWDDCSTDDTVEIARSHGAFVASRGENRPSFIEDESEFRSDGWVVMKTVLNLSEGDWVLTIDADEFLVGDVEGAIQSAEEVGYKTLRVEIPEMFLLDPLSRRVDGFWGKIDGFRLTQYVPGDQRFRPGMGCGTLPAYADRGFNSQKIQLLHLGYAAVEDRHDKYNRYSQISDNGHNSRHIQSILAPPSLVLWDGETPSIWRGKK